MLLGVELFLGLVVEVEVVLPDLAAQLFPHLVGLGLVLGSHEASLVEPGFVLGDGGVLVVEGAQVDAGEERVAAGELGGLALLDALQVGGVLVDGGVEVLQSLLVYQMIMECAHLEAFLLEEVTELLIVLLVTGLLSQCLLVVRKRALIRRAVTLRFLVSH